MGDSLVPFLIFFSLLGVFWLFVYCYLLYRIGRSIARRYRTRPNPVFVGIALGSGLLAGGCAFIPIDLLARSALIFAVWITHTQAIGWGFWAGIELGKGEDQLRFKRKAEEWLKEWEEPARKRPHDSAN